MAEWNHSICGECWFLRVDKEEGKGAWRMPARDLAAREEECCFCGNRTVLGIYVRHNPNHLNCKHEPDGL